MLRILAHIAVNGIGILVTAYFVPGVTYLGGILHLLLAGLVVGLINVLVRPIVTFLSLPFIVLTMGLFFLAINGALLYLVGIVLPGLTVDGCLPAILGGLVLAIFNMLVRSVSDRS